MILAVRELICYVVRVPDGLEEEEQDRDYSACD